MKVPNSPYGLCGRKATFEGHDRAQELCESPRLSCVKVEEVVLGSTSLTVLMLCGRKATFEGHYRAQELCESRGGRSGLPVPNSPYGLCGHKATSEVQELCESRDGRPGLHVPTSPSGLCGRKATFEEVDRDSPLALRRRFSCSPSTICSILHYFRRP